MPLSVGKPWEKFWLFLLVVLPAPAQSKRIGNLFSLVDVGDDDNCGIYDYCVPSGLGAVVAVSQGLEHTCAILADNRLVCFGVGHHDCSFGPISPFNIGRQGCN